MLATVLVDMETVLSGLGVIFVVVGTFARPMSFVAVPCSGIPLSYPISINFCPISTKEESSNTEDDSVTGREVGMVIVASLRVLRITTGTRWQIFKSSRPQIVGGAPGRSDKERGIVPSTEDISGTCATSCGVKLTTGHDAATSAISVACELRGQKSIPLEMGLWEELFELPFVTAWLRSLVRQVIGVVGAGMHPGSKVGDVPLSDVLSLAVSRRGVPKREVETAEGKPNEFSWLWLPFNGGGAAKSVGTDENLMPRT